MNIEYPLVLFDGVCNYCNAMVQFAIRNDKKAKLRFAPLQSSLADELRSQYNIPRETESVILIDNGEVYTYSDAALRICKYLDWPTKALYGLVIVPCFIRQPIYKWIARNRYKWFGKRDTCYIPTPDIKRRFLEHNEHEEFTKDTTS